MKPTRPITIWLTVLVVSVPFTAFAGGKQNIAWSFVPRGSGIGEAMTELGGEGLLLLYSRGESSLHAKIAIDFSLTAQGSIAIARVYDTPSGLDHVPIEMRDGSYYVQDDVSPRLVIRAHGGWWVKDDVPNLNLDLEVFGPVRALWGAIEAGYLPLVDPYELQAIIETRTDERGWPLWDLRKLVPEFPGLGVLRTNYAERQCNSPMVFEQGLLPEWPFLSEGGHFEQPNRRFIPPIVIDWDKGSVTTVSEIVTVRNQNCSFAFYSLAPLVPGVVNVPNFETPFAFYDFSEDGRGFPNAILRTGYFPQYDPDSIGLAPAFQQGRPTPVNNLSVRYSLRLKEGDGYWDFKIGMLGRFGFDNELYIADGKYEVRAPAYASFPEWISGLRWPVVTFVDAEGMSYPSSEGIYEWDPDIGYSYFSGFEDTPDVSVFSSIRPGFRGEYRFSDAGLPRLYLSPVDNRLHLLGAEGGMWNLEDGWYMRVLNLLDDSYIDMWELHKVHEGSVDGEVGDLSDRKGTQGVDGVAPARLLQLGEYLVFASDSTLRLKESGAAKALFTASPPSDHATWKAFREALAAFDSVERDPFGMGGWLEAFNGPELRLDGVSVRDIQASSDGEEVRLVLSVSKGATRSGKLFFPAFDELAPGEYVVTYDRIGGGWQRVAATTPRLVAFVSTSDLHAFSPGVLTLTLGNAGTLAWTGDVSLQVGDTVAQTWSGVTVAGKDSLVKTAAWSPDAFGDLPVTLFLNGQKFELNTIAVAHVSRAEGIEAFALSVSGGSRVPVAAIVVSLCLLLGCIGLWTAWRRV